MNMHNALDDYNRIEVHFPNTSSKTQQILLYSVRQK